MKSLQQFILEQTENTEEKKSFSFDLTDIDETCEKELIRRARYISFTEDGLWYRSVKPGDEISKGQVLGHTEDCFGNVLREYRAEEDGIVLYGNGGLKAAKGHLAVAYGRNAYREVLL